MLIVHTRNGEKRHLSTERAWPQRIPGYAYRTFCGYDGRGVLNQRDELVKFSDHWDDWQLCTLCAKRLNEYRGGAARMLRGMGHRPQNWVIIRPMEDE